MTARCAATAVGGADCGQPMCGGGGGRGALWCPFLIDWSLSAKGLSHGQLYYLDRKKTVLSFL